jgi:predicted kinase
VPTSAPRLVLMCGLPGSGKTTEARRLAVDYRAVRLSPDEWLTALGIDLWDEAMRDRVERVLWDLGKDLLRLGQSVILESGFWLRTDRDEKRSAARALGATVELRFLDVPPDELLRRLAHRQATKGAVVSITRSDLERFAAMFETPDTGEISLFDPAAIESD